MDNIKTILLLGGAAALAVYIIRRKTNNQEKSTLTEESTVRVRTTHPVFAGWYFIFPALAAVTGLGAAGAVYAYRHFSTKKVAHFTHYRPL